MSCDKLGNFSGIGCRYPPGHSGQCFTKRTDIFPRIILTEGIEKREMALLDRLIAHARPQDDTGLELLPEDICLLLNMLPGGQRSAPDFRECILATTV